MVCKNTLGLTSFSFRLLPGQDLKKEIQSVVIGEGLQAAVVISGVGSLKTAVLRLAEAKGHRAFQGPFEIVSLTGTLSQDGLHLHISLSDKDGETIGGHLMDGCLIHTTAEIVLLEQEGLKFERPIDSTTGYKELVITKRI